MIGDDSADKAVYEVKCSQLANVYFTLSNNMDIVSSPFFSELFVREVHHGKTYSYQISTEKFREQNNLLTNTFEYI